MNTTHDAIIIGTGQAGPSLASRLSREGMSVAIVERHLVGGTCVNTGCIPTKAMVASAYAAHLARRAAEYGVAIDGRIGVDMASVKVRKDGISAKSRHGLEEMLKGLEKCDVFRGHARFRSPREVAVGETLLRADRIFINVGGRAAVPELPGIDRTPFLTNSSMMDLSVLPEHLVVVGGSYVGLEFGQMFRRFGSQVTIVEMGSALIGREDADVSGAIRDLLEERRHRRSPERPLHHGQRRWVEGHSPRRVYGRRTRRHWLTPAAGDWPAPEYRRPWTRCGGDQAGRAGLCGGRRSTAYERGGRLGARRLQREGCIHPHFLQRLRDRRGQPSRLRAAPRLGSHSGVRALYRSAAWTGRPDRSTGSRSGTAGARLAPAR